jgi:ABC-type transport system substrate-binding protein
MNVTEVDHGATFTLPTYSPIPDDFLGWDANVDGMVDYEMGDEITVTIRDDVKFQNGEPLKASDVVFSYQRCLDNYYQTTSLLGLT